MKKLYKFINRHFTAVIRIYAVLLIPCAFSSHFATTVLITVFLVWMILTEGKTEGWDKED